MEVKKSHENRFWSYAIYFFLVFSYLLLITVIMEEFEESFIFSNNIIPFLSYSIVIFLTTYYLVKNLHKFEIKKTLVITTIQLLSILAIELIVLVPLDNEITNSNNPLDAIGKSIFYGFIMGSIIYILSVIGLNEFLIKRRKNGE